jgi:hypothetical protein
MKLLCDNLTHQQAQLMKTNKPSEVDTRNKSWILYLFEPEDMLTLTYGHLLTNLERQSELANTLASIGAAMFRNLRKRVKILEKEEIINNSQLTELRFFIGTHDKLGNPNCKEKLEEEANKTEIKEVHLAWFLLQAYLDLSILSLRLKVGSKKGGRKKKHTSYHVNVKDIEALHSIMETIDIDSVELFPMRSKPDHWESGKFYHNTGFPIIKKKPHQDAIKKVKQGQMDYVVDSLNKLGDVGWRINPFIFDVFKKAKTHQGKTPFKAMKEVDPEKKASLLIELAAIERLAERNQDSAFYHLYNCDFRGRIYPNTAFLHEQSSDNAKGLLLLDESELLGQSGLYWLTVHTANMLGNDKIELDDRSDFVINNWQTYLGYVEDPLTNDAWMDADKPLCFLACCYELSLIDNWSKQGLEVEDFPSNLPIYVDGVRRL